MDADGRLMFLRLYMIREERANLKLQPLAWPLAPERASRPSTNLSSASAAAAATQIEYCHAPSPCASE